MSRATRPADHRPAAWLRIGLPALLIVVWLLAAGTGGPYFGKVDEVSSNDPTAYVPESSNSAEVQAMLPEFTQSDSVPAVVVFSSSAQLTEEQLTDISRAIDDLGAVSGISENTSPAIPSDDGKAIQAIVPIDVSSDIKDVVKEIRGTLEAAKPAEVTVHITGPAGFASDLAGAFAGIDGLLLAVTLSAVLVILIIVYRSVLLPLVVLATSMFALCVALLTVWWLAKAGVLLLSGQTQGILFILVIGAATDYSLLYVARYREELRVTETPFAASQKALRNSLEPILASGGTVIAGLLCLLFSDLKSNSALGPVASIGIVFAMLAALTFLPCVLLLLGRASFWPKRPRYEPPAEKLAHTPPNASHHIHATGGLWGGIAQIISSRSRTVWIAVTVVLAFGALGTLQFTADGVSQSEVVLGTSDAREGQEALSEHFPGGSGSPVYVVVPQNDLTPAAQIMRQTNGIENVSVTAANSPAGTASVTEKGIGAFGPPGTPAPTPTVVEGKVLLQGTLQQSSDSTESETSVRELRDAIHKDFGTEAIVGGATATAIDTKDASIHDRNLIIPLILGVILLILIILLRSILAPLLLIATTALSFGTALGVSALVFNHIFHFPGADPVVPLYGFVFLVALGIDYNIFLMTRVREESKILGTRSGILRGLTVTGGVITSAGIVLAVTFAALSVIPLLFMAQISFIVAFGVLLDTFIVRSLLVPALSYDIGSTIWWPSRLVRSTKEPQKPLRSGKHLL